MATRPDPQADGASGAGEAPGAEPRRSIRATFTEVVADASGLVRTEAALARAETSANVRAIGRSSAVIGAGAVLMAVALIFLTVAGVVALASWIGMLWALLVMALLCGGLGFALVAHGQSRLSTQAILPERTLNRMSADLQKLAARGQPVRAEEREPA